MAGTKKSISTTKSKQKRRPGAQKRNRPQKPKKSGGMSCCCAKKNDKKTKKKSGGSTKMSLKKPNPRAPPQSKSAPMAPISPFPTRSPLPAMVPGPLVSTPPTMVTPPQVSLRNGPPKVQMVPRQANLENEKIATARDGGDSERKVVVAKKEEPKKVNLSKEKCQKEPAKPNEKPVISFKADPADSDSERPGKKEKKEEKKMIKEVQRLSKELVKQTEASLPRSNKTKSEELESDSNQPEQSLTIKRVVKNGRVIVHWTYEESYPVGMDRPAIQAVLHTKPKINNRTDLAESTKKDKTIFQITKSLAVCVDEMCKAK